MGNSAAKITPSRLIAILEAADMKEPCVLDKKEADQVVSTLLTLLNWIYKGAHEDVIAQSFTVICRSRVDDHDREGNPIEPLPVIYCPCGEGITPEDCIVLANEGIRWAVMCMMAQRQEMMKKMREEKERRIIIPGRGMPV